MVFGCIWFAFLRALDLASDHRHFVYIYLGNCTPDFIFYDLFDFAWGSIVIYHSPVFTTKQLE
jgi:hypothetical protein